MGPTTSPTIPAIRNQRPVIDMDRTLFAGEKDSETGGFLMFVLMERHAHMYSYPSGASVDYAHQSRFGNIQDFLLFVPCFGQLLDTSYLGRYPSQPQCPCITPRGGVTPY